MWRLTVRSPDNRLGLKTQQTARDSQKLAIVLQTRGRTKVPQLADPNSLRLVLIGWSLSQWTNQDAGRDAGVKGSLVYGTFTAWCGHKELLRLCFLKAQFITKIAHCRIVLWLSLPFKVQYLKNLSMFNT